MSTTFSFARALRRTDGSGGRGAAVGRPGGTRTWAARSSCWALLTHVDFDLGRVDDPPKPEATASTCPPCVHHHHHGLVQHDVAVVAVHVRLAIGRRRARPRGDLVPRPVVPFRGHGVCCALVVAPLGHRGPPRRAPRAPRGPVDELATGRPLGRRRRAAAVVQGGVSHATEPDARGRGGLRHHGAHGRGRRRGPRGAAQDRGSARPRGRPEHGVLRRRSGSPRGPRARRARRARLLVAGPRQPPRRRLPPRRRRPGRQRVVPPRADPRPPEFRRKFRISEHPSRRRARARAAHRPAS